MFKIDKSSVDYMDQNMSLFVVRDKSRDNPPKSSPPQHAPVPDQEQAIQLALEKQRTALRTQLQQEAKEREKKAWQAGFEAGKAGERDRQIAYQQEEEAFLSRLEAQFFVFKQEMAQALEEALFQLAFEVAEKILDKALQKDDEQYQDLLRAALAQVDPSLKLLIRVCARDFDRYLKKAGKNLFGPPDGRSCSLVRDEQLQPGDCMIEFEDGFMNIGMASQLKTLAWVLDQGRRRT